MNEALYCSHAFRIEFCDDCYIPGHLIIRPQDSVRSLTMLTSEAQENLGPILALGYHAIEQIIQPERIYTLSFCEVLPLLHFHLFPRTKALGEAFNTEQQIDSDTVNGALFFDWSRKRCQEKSAEYQQIQEKIRHHFSTI